jgi:hypothetical protein
MRIFYAGHFYNLQMFYNTTNNDNTTTNNNSVNANYIYNDIETT